jgi:hypothetical protein
MGRGRRASVRPDEARFLFALSGKKRLRLGAFRTEPVADGVRLWSRGGCAAVLCGCGRTKQLEPRDNTSRVPALQVASRPRPGPRAFQGRCPLSVVHRSGRGQFGPTQSSYVRRAWCVYQFSFMTFKNLKNIRLYFYLIHTISVIIFPMF